MSGHTQTWVRIFMVKFCSLKQRQTQEDAARHAGRCACRGSSRKTARSRAVWHTASGITAVVVPGCFGKRFDLNKLFGIKFGNQAKSNKKRLFANQGYLVDCQNSRQLANRSTTSFVPQICEIAVLWWTALVSLRFSGNSLGRNFELIFSLFARYQLTEFA